MVKEYKRRQISCPEQVLLVIYFLNYKEEGNNNTNETKLQAANGLNLATKCMVSLYLGI